MVMVEFLANSSLPEDLKVKFEAWSVVATWTSAIQVTRVNIVRVLLLLLL